MIIGHVHTEVANFLINSFTEVTFCYKRFASEINFQD